MTTDRHLQLRRLPAVSALLEVPMVRAARARYPHPALVRALQGALEEARGQIRAGGEVPALEAIAADGLARLEVAMRPRQRRVVNATGVVLNTNLGRAPLPLAAQEQLLEVARHYGNLEYDLDAGARGSRMAHVEELLVRLTGAEAALVVNNNAAAVLLVVDTFARGREVVVSRGQLIEIGGSFRIPEVLTASGARLVEVGTTNKTYLSDYQAALAPATGMLLRCHTSNYRVVGFTHEVAPAELATLAHAHGTLAVEDLGSGTLMDLSVHGLPAEPTVQQTVAAGMDLVTFSGDKLLGGPQAGIIVGRAELVARLHANPLLRALRQDKLGLAALEATLRCYLDPHGVRLAVPTLAMLTREPAELATMAQDLAERLRGALGARLELATPPATSAVGGGALPTVELPTTVVALVAPGLTAHQLAARLRQASVPVIARVEQDRVLLDPRTWLPDDPETIVEAVREALA